MAALPTGDSRRPSLGGVAVSPIAWGMWRLAKSYHNGADVLRLVHHVLETGITLFDTADTYGLRSPGGFGSAEKLLGEALAMEPALRNRMFIATKGGIRPPTPYYDQDPAYLSQAIDASLTRLRVDVIDLWQIHRPDILTHPGEVAKVLDRAVAAGKIRMLGVSNFSTHQVTALQHVLEHKLVSTQPEISPLQVDCFHDGVLDQAMVLDMAVLAWSPLGGGKLVNPETEREKAVAEALDKVMAGNAGVSRAAAAYSWLMAHPAGIIPIIGSQRPQRIAEAADALRVGWTRQDWYSVFIAARGKKLNESR